MVLIRRGLRNAKRPSVTVVIPCYNYGHFLPEAVQSVLAQERVDARVILVDDASTDDSLEVARWLASCDRRVTVVAHEENAGHISTYNDGLSRVTTEFVVLLSADDFLAEGALARATDLMAANPKVGLVYGRPKEFSEGQAAIRSTDRHRTSWTVWKGREWVWISSLRGRCFILSPEVVMRTAALVEVGSYNSDLPHSGDLEFWLRTAARWDIGRVNGPVQAYYRSHGENMHLTSFAGMDRDLIERLKAFAVLNTDPVKSLIRDGSRLYRMAARGIAREARILAVRNADSGGGAKYSAELLRLAREIDPAVHRRPCMWFAARRCSLGATGRRSTQIGQFAETVRRQSDRVRWVLWKKVGIS